MKGGSLLLSLLQIAGVLSVFVIDIVIFIKNIKVPAHELKHTFIMLQIVFGVILLVTGNGLGALLYRLLLCLLCFIFSGKIVKLAWGLSVGSSLFKVVSVVLGLFALFGG